MRLDKATLLLQTWIDGTNAGLMLRKRDEDATVNDGRVRFYSGHPDGVGDVQAFYPKLTVSVVPEPSAFLLVTVGSIGLGFSQGRRRRR